MCVVLFVNCVDGNRLGKYRKIKWSVVNSVVKLLKLGCNGFRKEIRGL